VHAPDQSNAIRVWRIWLDQIDLARASDILDRGELQWSAGLATPPLRRRFLARRMALRQILGGELGIDPAHVAIGRGDQGKPHLLNHSDLLFNVSHSGAVGLLAVSARGELGIDIEQVREVPHWTEIVREYFEASEQELLLRPERSARMFLSYWTRKEAVAKATGLGLSLPLRSFAVSNFTGEDASIVIIPDLTGMARKWHVRDLTPGPSHIAALASSHMCDGVIWKNFPTAP
jgi:4'-phosphopantetheinyl transferase